MIGEYGMNVTILDLRKNMKKVLHALDNGESITLTYRGKKKAMIVSCDTKSLKQSAADHPAFGMWSDRNDMSDVNGFVRNIRKGRF